VTAITWIDIHVIAVTEDTIIKSRVGHATRSKIPGYNRATSVNTDDKPRGSAVSAFVVGLRLTCPRVNSQWITPTAGHASSAEYWAASSEDNAVLNLAETSMYIILATRTVIGAIARNNEKSAQKDASTARWL